jgi:hypothetical protein
MKLGYSFSQAEADAAYNAWGSNCGPGALAFALRLKPDDVRSMIPGFDEKRYTSPVMMATALNGSGHDWTERTVSEPTRDLSSLLSESRPSLVRIQWTGPWTQPGANPKWAYRHTHWICAWLDDGRVMIFDINGGIRSQASWEAEVIPPLLQLCVPRADGGWYATHVRHVDARSDRRAS